MVLDPPRAKDVPVEGGVLLSAQETGPQDGRPVVALHGVIQTRENVLKAGELERNGYRVIAYDARGHGRSGGTTDPDSYNFDVLLRDLIAVMDAFAAERALLAGVSIGGITALRLAIEQPERVAGLLVATPAFDPATHPIPADLARGDRVGDALRAGDAAALVDAQPVPVSDPKLYDTLRVFAQRTAGRTVSAHRDRDVAAAALHAILRARPFESLDELAAVRAPAIVVGSLDEYDGNHPLAVARAYAAALPDCSFTCEEPGKVPFAWKGRELSRIALELAGRAAWEASEPQPAGRL